MTRLTRLVRIAALGIIMTAPAAEAQQVTISWDPSPDTSVSSYVVSWGTQPLGVQPYSATADVGKVTQWAFTPPDGTQAYYFAVQAKSPAGTSAYSNEAVLEPRTVVPAPAGSGDLNGDGRIDLLWQHQGNGLLTAWFMSGAALAGSTGLTPTQVADTNWKIVGEGDFNRDGQLDLLWQHQTTRLMTVWLMNGTTFVAPGLLSNNTVSDTNWEVRAVADMNGDNWPDLVWQHRTNGTLVVWIMNGLNLVEGRTLGQVSDTNWKVVGTGDFDGDGDRDLVWQHQTNGTLSLWLMNGTTVSSGKAIYPSPVVSDTNWKVRAVADLNGDRKPDLIWQHETTGALAVWFMNGATVLRTASLAPSSTGDLSWTIVGPK